MRRRDPLCAFAPNLSPAESISMSSSKSSRLPCCAHTKPPQVALRTTPRRGVIRVAGAGLGPPQGALASARCSLFLKTTLSPRRGAHFACPSRGGPHPGLAKLRSRLHAVPILSKIDVLASAGCHFRRPWKFVGALWGRAQTKHHRARPEARQSVVFYE